MKETIIPRSKIEIFMSGLAYAANIAPADTLRTKTPEWIFDSIGISRIVIIQKRIRFIKTDPTEAIISSERKKANPTPNPMTAKMTQKASMNPFEIGLVDSLGMTSPPF